MKANKLSENIAAEIRKQVYQTRMDFSGEITAEIEKSKEREESSETPEDKQYHRGVHVGMMHVLIRLSETEI